MNTPKPTDMDTLREWALMHKRHGSTEWGCVVDLFALADEHATRIADLTWLLSEANADLTRLTKANDGGTL